jgi:hypothetical protein
MDGKAYMDDADWKRMLRENKWTVSALRDDRYDQVCHLVTAAIGAEEHYGLANNRMRSETPEQARVLDERLQQAWAGHPSVCIFENEKEFQEKLQHVADSICATIGLPVSGEKVLRFLLDEPVSTIPVPFHEFVLTKCYLVPDPKYPGSFRRIESRTGTAPGSRPVYRYKEVRNAYECDDQRFQHRILDIRRISRAEYAALERQATPDHAVTTQRVRNFLHRNEYFSLVTTMEPADLKLDYLSVNTGRQSSRVQLPDWIRVSKEVTNDANYTSHMLSRIHKNKD